MSLFHKIFSRLFDRTAVKYPPLPQHSAKAQHEAYTMSIYTDSMVSELMARASWTYDDAAAFSEKHPTVSTRSVISKIKSLKLDYVAKPKASGPAKTDKVRKSEIVADIAAALSIQADAISGLSKADAKSLRTLLGAVK